MAMHWDEQTYYELLEIAPNASESDIRQAYQRAKTTYSQDNPALYSVFTKEETRQLLVLIEEAYGILSNQTTRRAYDSRLTHSPFPAAQYSSQSANSHQASQGHHLKSGHPADEFIKNAGQNAKSSQQQNNQTKNITSSTPNAAVNPNGKSNFSSPANNSDNSSREGRESGAVRSVVNPALAIPAGHGRSLSGHYPLNKELETYILETSDTDGPFLTKVRQYKKVELEQMSEKTRISKTYLNAVEKNDYSSLPAPVFVRGFIIQISRALGLDENKTAKGYMEKMKSVKP